METLEVLHLLFGQQARNMNCEVNAGFFFQHFRQNSAGRKLPKFQNSAKFFAKTHKFLPKLANFCSKLSFPAKISNFYYIRVLEKLADLVKTQPNFKTQPQIFPKLSFPAILVAVHAAQSLKKKAC